MSTIATVTQTINEKLSGVDPMWIRAILAAKRTAYLDLTEVPELFHRRTIDEAVKAERKSLRRDAKAAGVEVTPAQQEELAQAIKEFVAHEDKAREYGIFKDSFVEQPVEWLVGAFQEFYAEQRNV